MKYLVATMFAVAFMLGSFALIPAQASGVWQEGDRIDCEDLSPADRVGKTCYTSTANEEVDDLNEFADKENGSGGKDNAVSSDGGGDRAAASSESE